jgi:transposase
MSLERMGPCLAVEGATTNTIFEAYIGEVLAPSLKHGQIVVVDNLSAHKSERVRELLEDRGGRALYLPPYSPDFNPIEEAFSKNQGCLAKSTSQNA